MPYIGIDLNQPLSKTYKEWSPMHACAYHNNMTCAEYLYQNSGLLNLRDSQDRTPLHVAAEAGNCDFVMFLLKRSARYELTDEDEKVCMFKKLYIYLLQAD